MTLPRILIAPHARELETPLGRLHASIVYDQFFGLLTAAGGLPLVAWAGTPGVDDLLALADGVLLIGGGDVAPDRFGLAAEAAGLDRRRDDFETRLVHRRAGERHATARGLPGLPDAERRARRHAAAGRGAPPGESLAHRDPRGRGRARKPSRGGGGGARLDVNSFHDWAAGELGAGLRVVAEAGERGRGDRARGRLVGARRPVASGAARRPGLAAALRRVRRGGARVSAARADVLVIGAGAAGGVVGLPARRGGLPGRLPRAGRLAGAGRVPGPEARLGAPGDEAVVGRPERARPAGRLPGQRGRLRTSCR